MFDDEQCKAAIELLDVYARDLMGGGEELSAEVKQNLPAELRYNDSYCDCTYDDNDNEDDKDDVFDVTLLSEMSGLMIEDLLIDILAHI